MLLQGNDAGLYGVQTINYYEAELVNKINNDLSNGLLDNNSKQLYYTQIDKKTKEDLNNFLNLTTRYPYALKNVCNILNIIRYSNLDFNFTGINDIVAGRPRIVEYFNQNDLPIINLTDLFYDVNKFSSVNKGKNTLIKYFGLVSGLSLHLYANYKYLYDNPVGPTNDAQYPPNLPFIPAGAAGAARNYDDFIYRIGIHRYDNGGRAINNDKYMINNIRILAILHQTRENVIGGLNTIFSQSLMFPSDNLVTRANWDDIAGINNIDKVYKLLVRSSLANNVIILDNLKNNSNNFQGFNFDNKDYDNLETFSNLEDINDKDVSKALTIALLSLYSGINYIRKVKSLVLPRPAPPAPPAPRVGDANILRIYDYLQNDIDNTTITRIYDEINSQIFNNNNQLLSQQVLDEIINKMEIYKQTIANENSEIINEKLSIYATLCLCFKSLEQIPNPGIYLPIEQVVNMLYNPVGVGIGIDFFNIPSQIRPISNVASKICDNLKSFKSVVDPSVQTTERQGNQILKEESELDKIYALISKNDGKYSNIKNNLETNTSYHNLKLVINDYDILIKQYLSNPIDINRISDDEPMFKQQLKIIDNVRKQLDVSSNKLPELEINDDNNKESFERKRSTSGPAGGTGPGGTLCWKFKPLWSKTCKNWFFSPKTLLIKSFKLFAPGAGPSLILLPLSIRVTAYWKLFLLFKYVAIIVWQWPDKVWKLLILSVISFNRLSSGLPAIITGKTPTAASSFICCIPFFNKSFAFSKVFLIILFLWSSVTVSFLEFFFKMKYSVIAFVIISGKILLLVFRDLLFILVCTPLV